MEPQPPVCPACGLEPPDPNGHARRHGFDTLAALEATLDPTSRDEKARRRYEAALEDVGYTIDDGDLTRVRWVDRRQRSPYL